MSNDIPPSDLELALELRLANEKLSIFSFFYFAVHRCCLVRNVPRFGLETKVSKDGAVDNIFRVTLSTFILAVVLFVLNLILWIYDRFTIPSVILGQVKKQLELVESRLYKPSEFILSL